MKHVRILLKGWRDAKLFADAFNDSNHPRHEEARSVQMFCSYKQGEPLYEAITYDDYGDDLDSDDIDICERAFREFNIGDDVLARRYRKLGNRSLSVGDVVEVDGQAYGCGSFGWDKLDFTVEAS